MLGHITKAQLPDRILQSHLAIASSTSPETGTRSQHRVPNIKRSAVEGEPLPR